MKVIKVDDLKKVLDLEKVSLENNIKGLNNDTDINFSNYLEGKLKLVGYINRVIEILQFEIKEEK